jgi:hypothetical protein
MLSHQLEADWRLDDDHGAVFTLSFPYRSLSVGR